MAKWSSNTKEEAPVLRKLLLLGAISAGLTSIGAGCVGSSNTVEFPDDPVTMPAEDDESSDEQQQESEG